MDENVNKKIDIVSIEKKVTETLRDFQLATVERIDKLYGDKVKRVLVSDEVGLGKTFIAKGVIAKFIRMRFEAEKPDNLVKIVYICSNGAIARQNLEKLLPAEMQESIDKDTGSSRLSMQHLKIFQQEKRSVEGSIQLIPLTPETSFNMGSKGGWKDERALICAVLEEMEDWQEYKSELNKLLIYGVGKRSWKGCVDWYRKKVEDCNCETAGKYLDDMKKEIRRKFCRGLGKELKAMLDAIRYQGKTEGFADLIKKLRLCFAEISVERLQADLIIMDEFQRFKELLHPKEGTETEILKKKFFEEHNNDLFMLLLSATPYKMYSTLDEIDENAEDEHYKEFMEVMGFLNGEDGEFKEVWHNYATSLRLLEKGDTALLEAKCRAEDAMYKNVCRTERISENAMADMICASDKVLDVDTDMALEDVKSYLAMQAVADIAEVRKSTPIDFIKSAPYVMSFMQRYVFKNYIVDSLKKSPDRLKKIKVREQELLWIKRSDVNAYRKLKSNNGRLEHVRRVVFEADKNAELLLWVPPSMPYYEGRGPYAGAKGFSKTLIFSAWEMVPRMVSVMLSYEAERRTIGVLGKENGREGNYFAKTRFPSARLEFDIKDKKPAAMAQMSLIYPSRFLAKCYSPAECMNKGMSLDAIERQVAEKIKERLMKIPYNDQSETVDNRWYYLAPLLIDTRADAERWLVEIKRETSDKALKEHIIALETAYKGVGLGRMPADIVEHLVNLAIASPAVCAYRAYRVYAKSFNCVLPTHLALAFIKKMNTAEATAVVELAAGGEKAQWRALVEYFKNGNIQAMMDEYMHMLAGGKEYEGEELAENIHNRFTEALNLGMASYNVETYASFTNKVTGTKIKSGKTEGYGDLRMRTHFAVAFTKGVNDEKSQDRKISVREAFNSPFWPFVLTSTSIGQEGLDFHNYCRRIVHWNLPSNPIDIEQREGRINRFECYAIRQNVAARYGHEGFKTDKVWQELFENAKRNEAVEGSELVPHWGLTEREDMIRIERIVPAYPYSKDIAQYERLIKILSLYRLSLGQPRQEELLEYVFKNVENPEKLKSLFINLSPFYRKEVEKNETDTD